MVAERVKSTVVTVLYHTIVTLQAAALLWEEESTREHLATWAESAFAESQRGRWRSGTERLLKLEASARLKALTELLTGEDTRIREGLIQALPDLPQRFRARLERPSQDWGAIAAELLSLADQDRFRDCGHVLDISIASCHVCREQNRREQAKTLRRIQERRTARQRASD